MFVSFIVKFGFGIRKIPERGMDVDELCAIGGRMGRTLGPTPCARTPISIAREALWLRFRLGDQRVVHTCYTVAGHATKIRVRGVIITSSK